MSRVVWQWVRREIYDADERSKMSRRKQPSERNAALVRFSATIASKNSAVPWANS